MSNQTTETLKPHLAHGEHLLDYFSGNFTDYALRHYPKIAVGLTETRVLLVPFEDKHIDRPTFTLWLNRINRLEQLPRNRIRIHFDDSHLELNNLSNDIFAFLKTGQTAPLGKRKESLSVDQLTQYAKSLQDLQRHRLASKIEVDISKLNPNLSGTLSEQIFARSTSAALLLIEPTLLFGPILIYLVGLLSKSH